MFVVSYSLLVVAGLLGTIPALHVGVLDFLFFATAPGFVAAPLILHRTAAADRLRYWAALVFSPGVLTALLLLGKWGLNLSQGGFVATTRWGLIAALAALLIMRVRAARPATPALPMPLRLSIWVAALTVLIAFVFLDPVNRLSVHGVYHGAHINEIVAGLIPPDNPAFAGETAHDYWAYHLLYAFMAELSGLAYYDVSSIYQALCFVLYMLGIGFFVVRMLPAKSGLCITAVTMVCAIGLNIQGPLFFVVEMLRHGGSAQWWKLGTLLAALGGPWLEPTVHGGIFVKFITFNGFIFGLISFAAMAVFTAERWYLATASTLFGMILLHPQTAMFSAPVFGLAWLWREVGPSLARAPANIIGLFRDGRAWKLIVSFGGPFVLAAPYILTFVGGDSTDSIAHIRPSAFSAVNWVVLYLLPLPAAAVGLATLLRQQKEQETARYLIGGAAGALFMAQLLDMPYFTQYKFLYLSGLFVWLLAVYGLVEWNVRRSNPAWRRISLAIAEALTLANAAVIALAWALSPSWFGDRVPSYGKDGYALSNQAPLSKLLDRAKAELPTDAILVEDAGYCEDSLIGMIAGRRSYYVPCYYFTSVYPDEARRKAEIAAIFNPAAPDFARLPLIAQTRHAPIFLLLDRGQLTVRFAPLVAEADRHPDLLAPLAGRGEDAVLYRVTAR
jgi:hypothetical protein